MLGIFEAKVNWRRVNWAITTKNEKNNLPLSLCDYVIETIFPGDC